MAIVCYWCKSDDEVSIAGGVSRCRTCKEKFEKESWEAFLICAVFFVVVFGMMLVAHLTGRL